MASSPMLEVIKRAMRAEDIAAALAGADVGGLAGREVTVISRQIDKLRQHADIRIAYLGNHTIEPLPQYVSVAGASAGVQVAGYVGDFNQYYQEILGDDRGLRAFDPDLMVVSLSLRELAPQVYYGFSKLDAPAKRAEHDAIVRHIVEWADAAIKATNASLLIANFVTPAWSHAGIADLHDHGGETEFYMRLNLELMIRFAGNPRVYLFDLERVVSRFGKSRAFNATTYYLARMPWQEELLPHLAEELVRYVHAYLGRAKKCLVLDLDNTLWGGVVGEDGPEGIEIGQNSPAGEAFAEFQQAVLALKNRGIILAINTKNNYDDVQDLFRRRQDMPLKLEDFSSIQINWDSKHENVIKIAQELNIGIDSLVFVDDNPAECALIAEMLPAVTVVQLSGDPAQYADLLHGLRAFEKLSITEEDRVKARQYQENRQRSQHLEAVGDLDRYLAGLETEVSIRAPSDGNRARVHQLFAKTNQFNLTTKRYSPADIDRFMQDGDFVLRIIDAKDRFGELGTIGVYLIDLSNGVARVDSFLMSCRAIGRGIETAAMNGIKEQFLLKQDYTELLATFVPTKKNLPARDFYESQGFALIGETASGERSFTLRAGEAALIACPHVVVR